MFDCPGATRIGGGGGTPGIGGGGGGGGKVIVSEVSKDEVGSGIELGGEWADVLRGGVERGFGLSDALFMIAVNGGGGD